MKNKQYCPACNKELEDGEIVVWQDKIMSHFRQDCNYDKEKKHSKIGVFYQGNVYDVYSIVRLSNLKSLRGGLNMAGTGIQIKGNLEGLLREHFFS